MAKPKLQDLTSTHVRSVDTRQKLTDAVPASEREGWWQKMGQDRNVPKYWDFEVVLAACVHWQVEPVLTKTGAQHVKDLTGARSISGALSILLENGKGGEAPPKREPEPEPEEEQAPPPKQERREEPKREEPKREREGGKMDGATLAELKAYVDEKLARGDEATKVLVAGIAGSTAGAVIDTMSEKYRAEIRKEALDLIHEARPQVLRIVINDEDRGEIKGHTHEKFARAVRLLSLRKPVFMIGPTGCGKTHMAEQLADAMKARRFASLSLTAGTSESKLVGGYFPIGEGGKFEYLPAELMDIVENGGGFLFDEIDSADANLMLVANTLIANGYIDLFGYGRVTMHPDCYLMAAANTHGTGANRLYVGRNQLDDATLDRFRVGQIEMDYDRKLERKLIPDAQWLERCWQVRDKINQHSLRRSLSTRWVRDAADMIRAGSTPDEELGVFVSGWTQAEKEKVGLAHL